MPSDQTFRIDRIISLWPLDIGAGLEIGPLDSPLARKSSCNVRYVDVVDTQGLRDHYLGDPNVGQEDIVDVDYSLHDSDGIIHSLAEVVAPGAPFDWVLASHVVEHVPDLIGWLADIAQVVTDDGRLLLAIPDRRYTFDVRRPQTSVGQILQAHTDRDMVPSERAVYDYFRSVVTVSAVDLWADVPVADLPRCYTFDQALDFRRRGLDTAEYLDSHVWMFTPRDFVEQITDLGRLDLCDFVVDKVIDTAVNELEFYVSLRRIPRGLDPLQTEQFRALGMQEFVEEINPKAETTPDQVPRVSPPNEEAGGQSPGSEAHLLGGSALSDLELRLINGKRRAMAVVRQIFR
ncbi:MAG: methyltransferase domain-containing protein [Acidimicrobiales bacterium]